MRKSFLLVLVAFLISLMLAACQTVEGKVEMIPQPTTIKILEATSAPADDAVAVITPATVTPEVVYPTPATTEESLPESEGLECDQDFCLMRWPGWLERPIGDGYVRTIDRSYPYGSTGDGTLDPHHGVEFPNGFGTPVLAAQAGEVVFAGMDDISRLGPFQGFYGNVVVLQHPAVLADKQDIFTLYAHLSEIDVEVGQQVVTGEVIGKVGASGAADGSHLHFEVRVESNDYAHTVNPVLWFVPEFQADQGEKAVLAGVILDRGGHPVPQFALTLEKISEEGSVEVHFYPKTYYPIGLNAHPFLRENFALPDIPPGNYRLAFISGRLYEFFFTLEPGSLGFIKVQLD